MKGAPANYLGRLVPKENFRTIIYAPNGSQKLVESWAEFESNMESGVWFATKDGAVTSLSTPVKKSKSKPRQAKTEKKEEAMIEEDFVDLDEDENPVPDDAAFEVTADDGFLPKASE